VVLVAERPATELSAWSPGPNELVAVVEAAEKPGNLGAIIRTADAAGATAVIAADPVCDVFHPNAVRASLGLCFRMPIFRAESADAGRTLQKSGFAVFGAIAQEAEDYRAVDFPQRTAIVLGSEARGLTGYWRSPPVTPITIPMYGAGDSLNLSAAAAVLLFQAAAARSD
jgi:TrmH family RNA methyltransferase